MAAARKESKPLAPPSHKPGPRAPSFTLEEWRGSSSTKLSRTTVLAVDPSSLTLRRFGRRRDELWRKILEAFIPEGFPSSVTNDYVPYQVWDSLQGLSTYIRCMLSTQALLSAIGVGEKSATVIGATFQWFLRDFTGMLGGIMFTFYQGSNLDSNAKMWRLAADFMNDLGMLMDLLSPLFPSALMLIVCLGSLSRSFTGVASGATKAALTQHFSLQNNAADISAKEGSQETVATMVGMAIGMILAHITREHALAMWVSFISLTVFHMYANYRAVQCLQLSTMNSTRSSILLKHFMQNGTVLTPQEVSLLEPIFPFWASWKSSSCEKSLHQNVHLGVKISSFTHSEMLEFSASATSHYRKAKYVLFERKGNVMVVIHKEATTPDILRSFFHAAVLASFMGTEKSVHTESRIWMEEQYPVFIDKLKSEGWAIERLIGGSIVWRAHWTPETLDEKMN